MMRFQNYRWTLLMGVGFAGALVAAACDSSRDSGEDADDPPGLPDGIDSAGSESGKSPDDSGNSGGSGGGNNPPPLPPAPGGSDNPSGKPAPEGAPGAEDCGEANFKAEPLAPNVMFVLDKSGSMSASSFDDGGTLVKRWAALHRTTKFLLENFDDRVNFGLKLFPSAPRPDDNVDPSRSCNIEPGVDVECAGANAQAVLDVLPGEDVDVEGDTPTAAAVQEAAKYMATLDDPNPEAIILIVDGRTNCGQTNEELAAVAADAFAQGIKVYVVGIDLDGQTQNSLNAVAVAGGTEELHNSTDSDALSKSLEKILGGIASCTIPLKPEPPFENMVIVELGTKKVPHLKDFTSCEAALQAGHAKGWVYHTTKKPFDEMELCGTSCDTFKASPQVEITYECPPPG